MRCVLIVGNLFLTLQCTFGYITLRVVQKTVFVRWHAVSVLAERVGQREVDGVTCRVLCTWWLLALAVKGSWLGPGGPPPPDCMDRLRKHYSHLVGGLFLARKAAWALSGCMTTDSADYCMLINSTWSKSRVCIRV